MKIKPHTDEQGRRYIGPRGTSFGRCVFLVNPEDRDYARHRYVLSFGAYGSTHLLIWNNSLDGAIEHAGEYLAKYEPGHIMAFDSEEYRDLVADACRDRGITFPEGFEAMEQEEQYRIREDAEADLTYTESGYLTSYEWGISMEDPTREELDDFCFPSGIDWTAERAA